MRKYKIIEINLTFQISKDMCYNMLLITERKFSLLDFRDYNNQFFKNMRDSIYEKV
jgi:hypothetical protein